MKLNYLEDLLRLVYPHICLGCGNHLHQANERICFSCMNALPYTNESIYHNTLNDKLMALSGISGSYALCYYNQDGLLQELMKELKYRNQPELGIVLGRLLGNKLNDQCFGTDMIIPVPLHRRKLRKRKYNQANQIAIGLSEKTGIRLDETILSRTTNTKSQTNRAISARFENVEQIFSVKNKERIKGQTILVVDDVITTGATIVACAEQLLNHGAGQVFVAAIGKADTLG